MEKGGLGVFLFFRFDDSNHVISIFSVLILSARFGEGVFVRGLEALSVVLRVVQELSLH